MSHYDYSEFTVTSEEVIESLKQIKCQKVDGDKGLWSNHIINSPIICTKHISLLLTGMFVHGYVVDEFLIASAISIPKDKKGDICDSDNYRGIALASSLT